jgi:ribose transport system ATP-binding protein
VEDGNSIVLEMIDISKRFGGIQALDHARFDLRQGEIHALLGENGAGKSTLVNIVSGIYKQDQGTIKLNGEPVNFRSPLAAKQNGIVKVHQELQLIPEMTVAQNIFLGNESFSRFGTVDFGTMIERSNEVLRKLDAEFDAQTLTRRLSTAQRQMVEIAKALLNKFSVLILDEPTASLTLRETSRLFLTIRSLRAEGKSIIYISHRLDEVFEVCDRATVMRDGRYIATEDVKALTKSKLIRMMTQRDISANRFNTSTNRTGEVVLEVKNFSDLKKFSNINFQLHKGEILGFFGLVGAGRTELMRAIFGAEKRQSGTLVVHGKVTEVRSPQDAIRAGIMLIPEDRKLHGFVGGMTNFENVSLGNLKSFTHGGIIRFAQRNRSVDRITAALELHPADNTIKTSRLSGGNQQKVVVAKAISASPKILILDEPTRGIDVNAKNEIYLLMKKLVAEGKSIIMVSSELPEILSLSDRIIVMHEGNVTGTLKGPDSTEQGVMVYAIGEN